MLTLRQMLGFLVITACASCAEPGDVLPDFEPQLIYQYKLVSSEGGQHSPPSKFANEFVPPDTELVVSRYEVPDYHCLRREADWADMPKKAVAPGGPAIFDILHSASQKPGALVFSPHGNSFEFVESLAVEGYKAYPDTSEAFGFYPGSVHNPVEQTTRASAELQTFLTVHWEPMVRLALAGATVVVPGNCWGDGGILQGEQVDAYYSGRRLGGAFDTRVWQWAKDTLEHTPDQQIAYACSGGGHRSIQEVLRQPETFAAMVLDSPADDVGRFIEEPLAAPLELFELIFGDRLYELMNLHYTEFYGSRAQAANHSLVPALEEGRVDVPVYLILSTDDNVVPYPVTQRLEAAIQQRPAPSKAITLDERAHCQLTGARIDDSFTWLSETVGFGDFSP